MRAAGSGADGLLGRAAGEGQEHVVEGGATQSHIGDPDALGVQAPQRLHQHARASGDRGGEPSCVVVHLDRAVGQTAEHAARGLRVLQDQRADVVDGVEQKMRIQAGAKSHQGQIGPIPFCFQLPIFSLGAPSK